MNANALIRGGRVVDPSQGLDAVRDIRVRNGFIAAIGEHLVKGDDDAIFEASGAYVAPGFIDMHVHLREPGYPEKETLATGTLAAARGGFTAVACMPNTNPAIDSVEWVRKLRFAQPARDDSGVYCRVYPIVAITKGRKGEEILDYSALAQAGAVGFSDDGNTVMNARVLREAALAARDVGGPFVSHALDENLHAGAVMSEGEVSRALGLRGSPRIAEDSIVARDLMIAQDTGKQWHIAHVSTAASLALILGARDEGLDVTFEVAPHHLVFTDEAVRTLGAAAKVNPPLRTSADARALCAAVRAGHVDVFATDHAPHTAEEKSGDITRAAVGFTGLEVAVGAYALAVPELHVRIFVEMLSVNPARILGVEGGTLRVGSRADITIFVDRPWTVDPATFASKGKSTPFAGKKLPRRVLATMVGGRLQQFA